MCVIDVGELVCWDFSMLSGIFVLFRSFLFDCFYLVICFCCKVMYICTVPCGDSDIYFVVILSEPLTIDTQQDAYNKNQITSNMLLLIK
jgi:hypothetical protein